MFDNLDRMPDSDDRVFHPEELLDAALSEQPRRPLRTYSDTIRVLKEDKQFTFREIADWLQERGVDCDHNAVYRQYTRFMPDPQATCVAEANEHLEEEIEHEGLG